MLVLRHTFLLLFFFAALSSVRAQGIPKIDSLINKTSKSLGDPFLTLELADSLLHESEKINYIFGLASGSKFKGIGLYYSGQPSSAFNYYKRSLSLFTQINDTLEIAKAKLNIATYYNAVADYDQSVQFSLQALEGFKLMNDLNGVGRVLNIIGQSYYFQGDYEKAKDYFKQYLANSTTVGDSVEISSSLSNTGAAFQELKQTDSAIYYLEKSVALKERLNFLGNIGTTYYNIGELNSELGDYRKAQLYFDKALEFYTNVNDTAKIAKVYQAQAVMAYESGSTNSSIQLAKKAKSMAEAIMANEVLKNSLDLLSVLYAETGAYQNAYKNLRDFRVLNDSLLNSENIQSINNLREEFQAKEREQQIELQQSALNGQAVRLQRNQIFIIALVVVLLLGITLFIIVRGQMKRKQLLIKKEAEIKVREAEINAVINSQEKERNRFARDLHDGFGQLISVLKLNLSQLNEYSAKDLEKRQEVFKNGESVINEMYTELRNICFDLMPQTLVKKGLSAALRELGDRINKSTEVACEVLIFDNNKRLTEIEAVSLFRISQEWVNNILKYASAESITIQLTREGKELTLTIEDNGVGFDPKLFFDGKGNGWKNIQTRLNLIEGEFDLDSRAGIKGTMVTVNLNTREIIPANTDTEMTTN